MKIYLLFKTQFGDGGWGDTVNVPSTFHGAYSSLSKLNAAKKNIPLDVYKGELNMGGGKTVDEKEEFKVVCTTIDETVDVYTDEDWIKE